MKIALLIAFAVILGVPLAFRPGEAVIPEDARSLVIISPHNELIRFEFSRAFDEWSREHYGEPAVIDWRVPGGTSEIQRQLFAEYDSALRKGPIQPRTMSYDLLFGGGSYEHGQMKRLRELRVPTDAQFSLPAPARVFMMAGEEASAIADAGQDSPAWLDHRPLPVQLRLEERVLLTLPANGAREAPAGQVEWIDMRRTIPAGATITLPTGSRVLSSVAAPVDFSDSQLREWYGENRIGRNTLYDPDRYWFGAALSAFGIVFNRDVLAELGVPEPRTWRDLTDPGLAGWVALGDPGQSGSINTTYEVILNLEGWTDGWRILREAAANSRYFANSSSKVPIDVSMGEAAAGMCIDFYGRSQAQIIADHGDPDRVGYVDPKGLTDIDPDPVTMLRGGRNPEMARRFIEFCLSIEGQALWQLPADDDDDDLGPNRFELRRLPIRRIMYERYSDRFVDQVNPFELARPIDEWNSDIRRAIPPLFRAMAIDNHQLLSEAWESIQRVDRESAAHTHMLDLFHAMPSIPIDLSTAAGLAELAARWRTEDGRHRQDLDRIAWTRFFRENYETVIELAESNPGADQR